ncbi:alpha-enolase [Cricetulus griseus]|nr:alpha-enolase [Cricetulus griseus]
MSGSMVLLQDLLELMKGLVLWNNTLQIHDLGGFRISKRSFASPLMNQKALTTGLHRPLTVCALEKNVVDLYTSKCLFRAAVPSGASNGIDEALELRDNDKTCYIGKGVSKAVEHINKTLAPALVSKKLNVVEQEKIDKLIIVMDITENKSKFGANAILGVSLAICKADATEKGLTWLATLKSSCQYQLSIFREAVWIGAEVYHNLKNVIKEKYGKDATNVGDEDGFVPNILENKEALELLKNTTGKASYTDKVIIGMDLDASEFFRSSNYNLDFKSLMTPAGMLSSCSETQKFRLRIALGSSGFQMETHSIHSSVSQTFSLGLWLALLGSSLLMADVRISEPSAE